jgi:hypothetical protein
MSTNKSFNYFNAMPLRNFKILSVFDHHKEELFNQYLKMNDEIINWGQSLTSQIRETVTERSRLLDQDYNNQKNCLEEKYQEYIGKALIYEKNEDNEQIGQLITQFNALKFQLAVLEYSMHSIPYLTLVTQDNLKHEQLRSIPIERLENDILVGMHTTESSSPTIPPRNTKQKRSVSITTYL